MDEEYREAFSEVDEIVKIMPSSLSNKIPFRLKELISKEKSTTYIPNISEPIENCQLKEKTIILLALIYRDFLCSEEEKAKLIERDKRELEEFEKELREKYNPNGIFKNIKNSQIVLENRNLEKSNITEYKEKNFIQRIFEKIKYLFKIKY